MTNVDDIQENDLLSITKEDDLWELFENGENIKFCNIQLNNGERLTDVSYSSVIISWYYWAIYRNHPETYIGLTKSDFVLEEFTGKVHLKILSEIIFKARKTVISKSYNNELEENYMFKLSETAMCISNAYYNAHVTRLRKHMSFVNILDNLEIFNSPKVVALKESFNKSVDGVKDLNIIRSKINETLAGVRKHLMHSKEFDENPIVDMLRSGVLNVDQYLQILVFRGFVTDTNDTVFHSPIQTGFLEGLRTSYDFSIEKCSASKAAIANDKHIADGEYFNRTGQLLALTLGGIDQTPCTGWGVLNWKVKPDETKFLIGKYHMVGSTPTMIEDGTDLVGQTIYIRSITRCNSPDPYTPCKVCMGLVSELIPTKNIIDGIVVENNPGLFITQDLINILISSVLGVKHSERSAVFNDIVLNNVAAEYLWKEESGSNIHFIAPPFNCKIKLNIPISSINNLSSITHVDPSKLDIFTISGVDEFELFISNTEDEVVEAKYINLLESGIPVSLSVEALRYIKEYGYSITGKNYLLDLGLWDFTLPFFTASTVAENPATYFKVVENFLKRRTDEGGANILSSYLTCEEGIRAFYEVLKVKIEGTSMLTSEVFTRVAMASSPETGDFVASRGNGRFTYVSYYTMLTNLTLSGALSYEDLMKGVYNIRWQRTDTARPNHSFDVIFSK